jgi:signal peptidase I
MAEMIQEPFSYPNERPATILKKSQESDVAPKKKGALRENIEAIVVAVILALFIRTFVVQAFKIPSGSMKDTLLIGDHILVNKFIYGVKAPFIKKTIVPIKDPQWGDIIVFEFPEDPSKDFIKRVIGVPGDVIEIRNKKLLVNGVVVENSHGFYKDPKIYAAHTQPRDNLGPITVPEGKLFVMGDNRDFSYDSRFWGFVDLIAVKGKAFIIYWSWDKEDFGVRWGRLGHLLE